MSTSTTVKVGAVAVTSGVDAAQVLLASHDGDVKAVRKVQSAALRDFLAQVTVAKDLEGSVARTAHVADALAALRPLVSGEVVEMSERQAALSDELARVTTSLDVFGAFTGKVVEAAAVKGGLSNAMIARTLFGWGDDGAATSAANKRAAQRVARIRQRQALAESVREALGRSLTASEAQAVRRLSDKATSKVAAARVVEAVKATGTVEGAKAPTVRDESTPAERAWHRVDTALDALGKALGSTDLVWTEDMVAQVTARLADMSKGASKMASAPREDAA